MPKQNEVERDIQDVGRILAAILGEPRKDPIDIVKQYVSGDLQNIQTSHPISFVGLGLMPLMLCDGAPVLPGGGGIVFQCVNRDIPELQYALKVTRPSLMKGKFGEEQTRSTDEYLKHAPLSHKNVARVFAPGNLNIFVKHGRGDAELPFHPILMEWITGAKPLMTYLSEQVSDWRTVVEVLAQVLDGLQHLHEHKLIHWDVKSDNVLVDSNGTPKIMDIGNARRSDVPSSEKALSTRRNVPPEILGLQGPSPDEPEKRPDSSRRTRFSVPDGWDTPWLDLWMAGRELNRLFGANQEVLTLDRDREAQAMSSTRAIFLERVFPAGDSDAQYAFSYLSMIIKRLLSATTPRDSYYYRTADSAAQDLRKLFAPFGAAQAVEELQAIPQRVLRLPRSGNAAYTRRFARLYNSSFVRSTTRHLQLGMLIQVYPGASHRRSEHTAGVVATIAEYVRALYANRTEPLWRSGVESIDIDALLVAGLLHDVGHMSFGHALEEMEGLLAGRFHEDYAYGLIRSDGERQLTAERAELRSLLLGTWAETLAGC